MHVWETLTEKYTVFGEYVFVDIGCGWISIFGLKIKIEVAGINVFSQIKSEWSFHKHNNRCFFFSILNTGSSFDIL